MAKYSHWRDGQHEALINILGEDNALALLRGEKAVSFQDVKLLHFDSNGRCIPRNLTNKVCDPNTDFHLVQPKLDYGVRLARIGECLHAGLMISAAEFEDRCQKLLERLGKDELCGNIVKAVHLPICIPQTQVTDYGEALNPFLLGVDCSYPQEFSGRTFNNYRKDDLAKKVKIVPGIRHDALVEKLAGGHAVGVYFPNPMQGFSVLAQREQIEVLPPWFWLSGGFDAVTAMVAYPDVLARDWSTPGLDFSALQWQGARGSLYFKANDAELKFDRGGNLGGADDYYSGGLFVLG